MNLRDALQDTLGSAYTLERELGGGGMSRVFVASEVRLKRKVVVKVLSPEMAEGISAERFEREIQLAASLQQANIVPLLNAGDAGGMPYYTMPFVDGESLRARLASGPLPIAEATSILRDVARALAYAHDRGIVHRDIKPDNVLLSRGTAVVTDFGIAKAIEAAQTQSGERLTRTGMAIGTPAYMAPEQAAGEANVDRRADFYAFGCMAYELLAGRPPFDGLTARKLVVAHLSEAAPSVTALRPDTPPELEQLIERCLAKDAADRPQNADELLTVLGSIPTGESSQSAADIEVQSGVLKRALGAYVVAFIVVAALAKVATSEIGLPDWVFPGALVVMALGLPVILFTAYMQYITRQHGMLSGGVRTPGSMASRGTMAGIAAKASPFLSWRRTALGGVSAVVIFALVVGAFMLLRALGIGPAGSLLAAGRLSTRDRLVVTDFRVRGADSSLSSVVSEAVRTELGQSNLVTILSPASVGAALQRMQRPATTPLDLALARDVAQREGAKGVVDGDVTPLGQGFVISLRLVTADSGIELASFHGTANGPTDLLPTLDKLARSLRGKMGEPLKSVHADPPLEQVTTRSLEALRKFAEARRANNLELNYTKAARLLEEAIAIDSGFAMAYRNLGLAYTNLDYPPEKSDSVFAKAYRYRDRLTERERYLAIANYFGGPGRDRAGEIAAYEEYLAHYPHEYSVLNNLAERYRTRRALAHAESLYRRSLAENSQSMLPYLGLVFTLLTEGRVDLAADAVAEVRTKFPNAQGRIGLANLVTIARDSMEVAETRYLAASETARDPQVRARWLTHSAALALERGRLADARRVRAKARALEVQRGAASSPLDEALEEALIDAWFQEQSQRAVKRLDSAVAQFPARTLPMSQRRDFQLASTYAIAGRADRARSMIAQFDTEVKDTTIRRSMEPLRHWALSEIAIAEGRAAAALPEIRKADTLPDGPADDCARCTYAALARAFDLAGMSDSAIVTFERYLATPYWLPMDPRADGTHLAGTYKRLGELYEAKGERQKAASYYSKFVELWKDADPELQPKVAEVRRRLARLSDTERR